MLAGLVATQGEVLAALRALPAASDAPATARKIQFSKASTTLAANAIATLGLALGGRLGLPTDLAYFLPSGELTPFTWAAGSGGEKQEDASAPLLLVLLEGWVRRGAEPPVTNLFLDVRKGTKMLMEVEGVAEFCGLPDAIVARRYIESEEEAQPYTAAAAFSVDWKRRSVMAEKRSQVAAIAHVQALAMASAHDFTRGQPVFFTDLASGFRCWLVLNSTLYSLHGPDADLSLAQGVALMRYLLSCSADGDALAVEDQTLTTSIRHQREVGPRLPAHPAGGAGQGAGAPMPGGGPARGDTASVGAGRAATKLLGAVADSGSPESDDTTVGDDGVDVDFRTLAMSIANNLARGGGFSLEGWLSAADEPGSR